LFYVVYEQNLNYICTNIERTSLMQFFDRLTSMVMPNGYLTYYRSYQ
jgi:hypothetical protein